MGFAQICMDAAEIQHGCNFLSIGSKYRSFPWLNKTATEILSMVTHI